MQIVKFNPFRDLQKMERDIDKFWDSGFSMLPTVSESSMMDMYEEDGKLITELYLPHFSKSEITVNAEDDVLEISADHKEKEEKDTKRRYYFRESSNHYQRRVALPDGVNADKAEATFKDGKLRISMPIMEKKAPKSLEVK